MMLPSFGQALSLEALFKVVDANQDGGIDSRELDKAFDLLKVYAQVSRKDYLADNIIRKFDKNGDWKLQFNELAP